MAAFEKALSLKISSLLGDYSKSYGLPLDRLIFPILKTLAHSVGVQTVYITHLTLWGLVMYGSISEHVDSVKRI